MKRWIGAFALMLMLVTLGYGQGSGPITVKEVDGSPACNNCRTIIFPNSSLTVSGNQATVASGGGSGTVTSISVVTANGVSASCATCTTTPALTFVLGAITPTTVNGLTVTTTSSGVLTIANSKTLTVSNTLTFTGTDGSSVAFGAGGTVLYNGGALGTPSSGTLTNATGLPPTTGISGWPANASGVLTNNGSGTLSWAAAGGSPGGSTTQLQYNNAGSFGGISTLTTDGTIVTFAPTVTTGTGATSGVVFAANSLTTGTGVNFSSSSVTSGSVVNIASTSTAAASNTLKGLNIAISGANGTTAQTVTGASISVTNTNATSGTNKALVLAASGATTANRAIDVTAGQIVASTGTITTDQPAIDLAQTWNNAGTTFTGLKLNVTSTASASASLLADFQIGGSSVFKLTRGGSVDVTDTGFSQYSFRTTGSSPFRADAAGVAMTANKLNFSSSYVVAFSSTSNWFDTADLFFRRSAAANLAFGAADAASPVSQTRSVQNVVGGTTNTAGATTTEIASLGTSQGAPGRFHIQTGGMIAASGTTQQTAVDRAIFGATKVLTNNSATTVANVTVASNTSAGGTLDYVVEVFDGTDLQYEAGTVAFGVTNKGGAFSGNTTTKAVNQQNATSGTLTVTWAISGANPGVLSVNANSSLTPSTGYPRVTYNLRSGSQQAIAIQ